MIPFILGAVALGATGYGVKKYIDSDIDRSIAFDDAVGSIAEKTINAITGFEEKYIIPDWYYRSSDENKNDSDIDVVNKTLQNFYTLRQSIYDGSYQAFQTTLKKIKHLSLDKQKKIDLNSSFPKSKINKEDILNISNDLFISLYDINQLFQTYITKVSAILEVSKDYKSYSKEAKKTLSDTLVLSNTINDILNINLINQNDKPTKSSKRLVIEVKKVLDSFKDETDEKLVA
ncbi:MAG: hypothetical protein U9N59_00055 [Campylobacterota bacterium]|nr:hypothetical protein [Campylobacterota bacterium]